MKNKRPKSRYAKDLRTPKYKMRVHRDRKKDILRNIKKAADEIAHAYYEIGMMIIEENNKDKK